GAVDVGALLGITAAAEDDVDARRSVHDGEAEHDHDDFDSFVVSGEEIANVDTLVAALAGLIAAHDVLRVKGMVAVAGKPSRLVVQAVGPRIQHYFDRAWQSGEPRSSALV